MNAVELIKLEKPFFHYIGTLKVVPETYDNEVCDICGRRRKCDWYEPVVRKDPWTDLTGMDICRQCQRLLEVKE